MIEIKRKEECCGCYSCNNICPKGCIKMEIDQEGFWYPKVDLKECVNCGLCTKVCPTKNEIVSKEEKKYVYACKNKNEEVRINSSSGGVFSILCEYVINNNGIVFGVELDKDLNVKHSYSENLDNCSKFQGSKYIQSKIDNCYKEAEKFLKDGKLVLFTGTSCQIKGLNLYLKKEYKNLITVDIICHGVPSPKVFNKYINSLKKSYKSNIKNLNFRNKLTGWREYSFLSEFNNGKVYSSKFKDNIYMKGFLKNLYLRPSCYNCQAKKDRCKSDLSLGDFWGINNSNPEFSDDKGISLVLINSTKGKEVFEEIKEKMDFIESTINNAVNNNPCIVSSSKYNKNRKKFFKELDNKEIENLIEVNIRESNITKLRIKLWYIKNKVIKLFN